MFTKQHFESVAKVLWDEKSMTPKAAGALNVVAGKLARMFQADNPRFDYDRFMEACQTGMITDGRQDTHTKG